MIDFLLKKKFGVQKNVSGKMLGRKRVLCEKKLVLKKIWFKKCFARLIIPCENILSEKLGRENSGED